MCACVCVCVCLCVCRVCLGVCVGFCERVWQHESSRKSLSPLSTRINGCISRLRLESNTLKVLAEESIFESGLHHGVATGSRIDKVIGLFCRILSLLYGFFAKETYNLINPTDDNQSHPLDIIHTNSPTQDNCATICGIWTLSVESL